MPTRHRVLRNLYRDSVTLMQLSSEIGSLEGVSQAFAFMGTPANLDLLRDSGVSIEGIQAKPNDLVIAVEASGDNAANAALDRAEEQLRKEAPETETAAQPTVPRSIAMGVKELPDANLALISTPGEYAAAEGLKALGKGLHVMMFSDNVSLEDEIRLKLMAHERGLLMMGPDCGTAIINGTPLGFANVVRRGGIGIIGASGTGVQQVTSLIDQWGGGISQAIGTGSRDLNEAVGAITMLDALDALAQDRSTRVIVLISKPPSPRVAEQVLARARQARKPVVIDFIGSTVRPDAPGIHVVDTLDEAAAEATLLGGGSIPELRPRDPSAGQDFGFAPGQLYLRGLFSGGTFSYESTLLLQRELGPIYSNTPVRPDLKLADPWKSREHTTVDLGDDEFTRGRPHPMIDYRLRVERMLQEAKDPSVALILLDVVLGYGSHPSPAEVLVPAVERARKAAKRGRRNLVFVASVCGTDRDPQQLSRQQSALERAGVILGRSNAEAARLAARVLCSLEGNVCHNGREGREHAGERGVSEG